MSEEYKSRFLDLENEFEEIQRSSRELERELEQQIEQGEAKLKTLTNSHQRELAAMQTKLVRNLFVCL